MNTTVIGQYSLLRQPIERKQRFDAGTGDVNPA